MLVAKRWWTSKTIWVNGLAMLSAVVTALAGLEFMQQYAQILLGIVTGVNIVLRFVTNRPVR